MSKGMTTEALIERLAKAPPPPPLRPARMAAVLALALAFALAFYWGVYGLRADLAAALARPFVLVKTLVPLMLGAVALWAALGSLYPGEGARLSPRLWPLLLPAFVAALVLGLALRQATPGHIGAEIFGQTALGCFLSITALAALPLWLVLSAMRAGAPLRPGLSGALAGLAAGGLAAAGYALHCTEDSPLFYVPWYGLAIALTALCGAALGRRLLRW